MKFLNRSAVGLSSKRLGIRRRSERAATDQKKLSVPAINSRIAAALQGSWRSRQFVALLREAAAANDVDALERLAMLTREGLNDRRGRTILKRSQRLAIRYYRRAAALGSPRAMDALATELSSRWKQGGKQPSAAERTEVICWYRRAISLGGDSYNLAVTYQNLGQHKMAVRWFRNAVTNGEVSALRPLAQAELYGMGVRRNVSAALAKLRTVAEATDDVSQFEREEALRLIAQVFYDGWLVRRDYMRAVGWLRRAADLGSNAARGLLDDLGESQN